MTLLADFPPEMVVAEPIPLPPTQDELPADDGEPMETQRHIMQMSLLIETLEYWLKDRDNGYVSGNMFVYFSMAQVRGEYFRGPDFFAVLNVPKKERKSWVVWEEGKAPDVIIELLSSSTAHHDKTQKKLVYQNQLRAPEYYWFDPWNAEDWAGFVLRDGRYQPLELDTHDRYVSLNLQLALIRWSGTYREVNTTWLRWATLEGQLLPTREELVKQAEQQAMQAEHNLEQEKQRVAQTEQRANQAEQRAEQLAAKLRALGINPDE